MVNWWPFPNPEFHANVSLYQILIGFFITLILGLLLQPVIKWVTLCVTYPKVSGVYSMSRDYGGGRIEKRDGRIEIQLKFLRGYHSVTAFHLGGQEQWNGQMHLGLGIGNIGTGVYWHVDQDRGVGDQKFRYIPHRREFIVQGTESSADQIESFFHIWKKEE